MTLTYVDSGVLIWAARGQGDLSREALQLVIDPLRDFTSSLFVRLEVLPKPIYFRRQVEVDFLDEFFGRVMRWAEPVADIVELAYQQAAKHGLAGMHALHIAAAITTGAEEFITTERPEKPIHRVTALRMVSLHMA